MAERIVDSPSSLTVAQLKQELREHNVDFPAGNKAKDIYVQLYLKNVSPLASPSRRRQKQQQTYTRSEFSADEEEMQEQPSAMRTTDALIFGDMDISTMTDDELAGELREHGVDVGPIIDTTRTVYQRKLHRLISGNNPSAGEGDADQRNNTIDSSFNEPVKAAITPTKKRLEPTNKSKSAVSISPSKRRISPRKAISSREQVYSFSSDDDDELSNAANTLVRRVQKREASNVKPSPAKGSISATELKTPYNYDTLDSASSWKSQGREFGGQSGIMRTSAGLATNQRRFIPTLPLWAQVALLMFVAILIFVVFQAMEPAVTNPVKP